MASNKGSYNITAAKKEKFNIPSKLFELNSGSKIVFKEFGGKKKNNKHENQNQSNISNITGTSQFSAIPIISNIPLKSNINKKRAPEIRDMNHEPFTSCNKPSTKRMLSELDILITENDIETEENANLNKFEKANILTKMTDNGDTRDTTDIVAPPRRKRKKLMEQFSAESSARSNFQLSKPVSYAWTQNSNCQNKYETLNESLDVSLNMLCHSSRTKTDADGIRNGKSGHSDMANFDNKSVVEKTSMTRKSDIRKTHTEKLREKQNKLSLSSFKDLVNNDEWMRQENDTGNNGGGNVNNIFKCQQDGDDCGNSKTAGDGCAENKINVSNQFNEILFDIPTCRKGISKNVENPVFCFSPYHENSDTCVECNDIRPENMQNKNQQKLIICSAENSVRKTNNVNKPIKGNVEYCQHSFLSPFQCIGFDSGNQNVGLLNQPAKAENPSLLDVPLYECQCRCNRATATAVGDSQTKMKTNIETSSCCCFCFSPIDSVEIDTVVNKCCLENSAGNSMISSVMPVTVNKLNKSSRHVCCKSVEQEQEYLENGK